jgi:hypothetical protein
MNIDAFLALSASEVAATVRAQKSLVCAFPINGTRRWFMLEHANEANPAVYLDVMCQRHAELYRMFFQHGVDTLLAPVFGADLTERGSDYVDLAARGLQALTQHAAFLELYEAAGVRVHFYGDYRKFLSGTKHEHIIRDFEALEAKTRANDRCRLFFGVFAQDATETSAELAIRFHQQHGRAPNKRELVELYYGEYVPPLDLFIGFDKFCMFDVPLLTTGSEDLYFTVSPSLYLTESQLREILYDHLYTRRVKETDYSDMPSAGWKLMRRFYKANQGKTIGVGAKQAQGEYWYPLPQVKLPVHFR